MIVSLSGRVIALYSKHMEGFTASNGDVVQAREQYKMFVKPTDGDPAELKLVEGQYNALQGKDLEGKEIIATIEIRTYASGGTAFNVKAVEVVGEKSATGPKAA